MKTKPTTVNDSGKTQFLIDNLKALLKKKIREDTTMSKYGLNEVVHGDPIYLDSNKMPIISLSFENISNETAGIGPSQRHDVIYTLKVKILHSEISDRYNYHEFIELADLVYCYISENKFYITENIESGNKRSTNHAPLFSDMTFGYERKFSDDRFYFANMAEFTITVQWHGRSRTPKLGKY